jgi:hypothetical protein
MRARSDSRNAAALAVSTMLAGTLRKLRLATKGG